jgi:hypothetical protein
LHLLSEIRIDTFFDSYAAAFRGDEAEALLEMFHVPFSFMTGQGAMVLDAEGLRTNMAALMERYRRLGAVDWRYVVERVTELGSGISLARVGWTFLDGQGEVLYRCDTSYFLTASAGLNARVMAIIPHNELEEYQKAYAARFAGQALQPE